MNWRRIGSEGKVPGEGPEVGGGEAFNEMKPSTERIYRPVDPSLSLLFYTALSLTLSLFLSFALARPEK